MQKLITNFQDTGICEVNVPKVIKAWTNKFTIIQHDEKYQLVKYRGKGPACAKVVISEKQAKEIIAGANLCTIQDSFFRLAKSYKKADFISQEINRLIDIKTKSQNEIRTIDDVIDSYNRAIEDKFNH